MLRFSATACVYVCVFTRVCESESKGVELYFRQTALSYIHTYSCHLSSSLSTHTHTKHTHNYLIHTGIDLFHALLAVFIVAFLQRSTAQDLDRDPAREGKDAFDDGDLCVCVCVCVCISVYLYMCVNGDRMAGMSVHLYVCVCVCMLHLPSTFVHTSASFCQ